MSEEPNPIERLLNDERSQIEGSTTNYTLAVNDDEPGGRWLTWELKIPWWLNRTSGEGRRFAETVHAALVAEGFEVRMFAETRFREELTR